MFKTLTHSTCAYGVMWWRWLIVFLVAAPPIAVALGFDIYRHFETTADGDIKFVYESLRLNAGLPQMTGNHTGYVIFVFIAWWFKLLNLFGALGAHTANEFPGANSPDFIRSYAETIFAARYFVALLSAGMAAVFFTFLRYLTNDNRIAAVIGVIFASSISIGDFSLFIRTDQAAFAGLMMAFIFLVLSARARRPLRLIGCMFACGFFSVLAMLAKVTAGPVLLTFPVIALFFGEPEASQKIRTSFQEFARNTIVLFFLTAATLAVPAAHMIVTSILHVGKAGYYQLAIVIYVIAVILIYARHYRTGNRALVIAGSALVIGIAVGCYTTYLYPPLYLNMNAISNFIERLYFGVSLDRTIGLGTFSWDEIIDHLMLAMRKLVAEGFFGLSIRSVLNPVLIVGCLLAWRNGAVGTTLQAMILLASAWAIEAVLGIHGIDSRYAIFIVFWKFVGLAILARWVRDTYGARALSTALITVSIPLLAINVSALGELHKRTTKFVPKASCGYSSNMNPTVRAGFEVYCGQVSEEAATNKGRNSAK